MDRVKLRFLIVPVMVMVLLIDGFIVEAQPFTFESWSNANTPVMTVGGFQSVAVDKRGKVWAGSTLGGLYCYRDSQWVKIGTYPDITFRHIVPSNLPLDSNAWASSIGKTGVQAISGGAYFINTKTETVTQYGLAGGLSSNYVNSLALSSQGEVFVANAQSTSGTTTRQGGIFKNFTVNPNANFVRAVPDAGDIVYHAAGNRGEELWFSRGADCKSGCKAPYIACLSAKGEVLSSITAQNSPLPFVASGSSPFARAIFTDTITGNTFVGLSSGGVGVMKPDRTWTLLTSSNSLFPASAAVNFNAISEVYGEIWIGTNMGVFVYNGRGSLDDKSSFRVLTTADGLPATSITDIALDINRKYLWVTTPFGVSRSPYVPPNIRGRVFDVSIVEKFVRDSTPLLYPDLNKIPLKDVVVTLLENGNYVERQFTDKDGYYELTRAIDGKTYSVEVEYALSHNDMKKFVYSDVKNRTVMESVLIPDKLISEVKAFKASMANRSFEFDLLYYIKPKYLWEGFDVSSYDKSFEQFSNPLGIRDLHEQRVDNLANFYSAAAAAHNLGGTSRDLVNEAVSKLLDLVQTLFDFTKILKKTPVKDTYVNGAIDMLIELIKIAAEKAKILAIDQPGVNEFLQPIFEKISYTLDFAKRLSEDTKKDSNKDYLIDFGKRALSYGAAGFYYSDYYCDEVHGQFVTAAALASLNAKSKKAYNLVSQELYQNGGSSLIYLSNNIYKTAKLQVISSAENAAVAGFVSDCADLASKVAINPITVALAPILKAASISANLIKAGYIADAMLTAGRGAVQIVDFSKTILEKSDLKMKNKSFVSGNRNQQTKQSITSLTQAKDALRQQLNSIKLLYNTTYDSTAFSNALGQLGVRDSAYNSELRKSINTLWSSADSASILIPDFTSQLNRVLDSFVSRQYSFRIGLAFQNLAYLYDTDKASYVTDLNNAVEQIKRLNDSTISGIARLIDSIDINQIKYRANLVQASYDLNHSRLIGVPGSFSYLLTNFGGEPITNVRFKISKPTAGYTITSADSIYTGTIMPGNSTTISFNFNTPLSDTLGNYEITVYANNGKFNNISGILYSYDPAKFYSVRNGNWSNPNVWINGVVPVASSVVEINHNILVDVDANCKTLRTIYPANLSVTPGKKLNVSGK